MKQNVALPDSYLRIGVAIALMLLVLDNWFSGPWAAAAIVVALILGVTAYLRFCPLYAIFGIGSTPKKKSSN